MKNRAIDDKKRETFQDRFGFIWACIGSAVGMGNIWLFPYRVGEGGGAVFLVPYFLFILILGVAGVAGEMAFGRAMRAGSIGAFRKATEMRDGKWGEWAGAIPTIGALGIALGYSVVAGWILKFFMGTVTGSLLKADSRQYFGELASSFSSIPWHMSVLIITFLVMVLGVSRGIEKVNKVLMPIFFALFLILSIRVSFLEGANKGYIYLMKPAWNQLKNVKTWVYALGQAFFSLSLAGSGTLVYGSYLQKEEDVISCARNVAVFDTIAAMLSAFVVIPAALAFGLDVGSGPALMFITMPKVFQQMPLGNLCCMLFFLAVFCAALTSLINLFETPVEAMQEKFGLRREKAVIIVAVIAIGVSVFMESERVVSTWMDVVHVYIVPLGALLAAWMFFWVCPKGFARQQVQLGRKKKLGRWFEPMTRYVFVGLTVIVYILGILYGGIG